MRINLRALGMALFSPWASVLDLDSGEILTVALIESRAQKRPKRSLGIQKLSEAVIYQRYLGMLFDQLPFEDTDSLMDYPEFDLHFRDHPDCNVPEFTGKAFHFTEYTDCLIEENRKKDVPAFDVLFPTYSEYCDGFQLQEAIKWCESKGLEGYDSQGPSRRIHFPS